MQINPNEREREHAAEGRVRRRGVWGGVREMTSQGCNGLREEMKKMYVAK